MRPLLLIGAGGFGREAAEVVRARDRAEPAWELRGFLDDDPALEGTEVGGVPVLGPVEAVRDHPDAHVVVCCGHPGNYWSRRRVVDRLGLPASRYATLVHPAAVLPSSATVGPGSVLLAGVVATAAVRLGAHVAVMPGVVLTHDDVVEPYASIAAGVRLGGRVRVGEGAYLGAGSLVREKRTVGPWSLVGMGAVVLDDVPAGEVWVGVPACRLRHAAVPADLLPGRNGKGS